MNKYRLLFIGIICAIYIMAYFIFISAGNVFQDFAFFHHFDEHLFPQINVIALRISTFAMILCVLRFFQSTKNQSILTLTMLSCLIIILLVPISFKSYPFISGLSHIVLNLMEPWRQFYIPAAFRATLEGIVAACCGLIDLSSISFEDSWSQHLDLYHYFAYIGMVFFILFVGFFAIIHRSEKNEPMPVFESIPALLYKNPCVFIACLFGGVNQAVFSYAFLLEKEILPNISPQNYQYLL